MTHTSPGSAARPISPHVGIWRWHVTMFASIAHRATGIALYGGALILAAWAVSLAAGPDAYALYKAVLGSILGKLVLFGLTVSAFYHLAAGVRHLVWDTGVGFEPKKADAACIASIAFGIGAAVLLWIIAGVMGAL
jgi:succinate dehydrogenase / fumarate reductase, cytochrome b subunit